jgi:ferredoxin
LIAVARPPRVSRSTDGPEIGSVAAAAVVHAAQAKPLRRPGSVPEPDFLDLCIRCGECFKVCPGPVLHPAGLEFDIDEMSTILSPRVKSGKRIGCGICTYRCHTKFVVQEGRLDEAAITIATENEHRRLSFPNTPEGLGSTDT